MATSMLVTVLAVYVTNNRKAIRYRLYQYKDAVTHTLKFSLTLSQKHNVVTDITVAEITIQGIFHQEEPCYYQENPQTNNHVEIYPNQAVSTGPIYTQCNIGQNQVSNFNLYQKHQQQNDFYRHHINTTDPSPDQIPVSEVIHDLVGSERPTVIVQQN